MNRSKSMFLLAFFWGAGMSANAQENEKCQVGVKLYGILMISSNINTNNLGVLTSRSTSVSFGNFSPAITLYAKKGHTHEIEFMSGAYNSTDQGNANFTSQSRSQNIRFRYEYAYQLFKNKSNKWKTYIGGGIVPSYSKSELVNTTNPMVFPNETTSYGLGTFIIPRLNYHLTDRLFIDLNIPIHITQNNYRVQVVDNPSIDPNNRETSFTSSTAFPNTFYLRLGLGVRI